MLMIIHELIDLLLKSSNGNNLILFGALSRSCD